MKNTSLPELEQFSLIPEDQHEREIDLTKQGQDLRIGPAIIVPDSGGEDR